MLSIGRGARSKKSWLSFEQLGVKNLIVEAKEVNNWRELRNIRKTSPGLTLSDYQIIRKNVSEIHDGTPRKRFAPSKNSSQAAAGYAVVYGVEPSFLSISGLHVIEGRFFNAAENAASSPVCVLGLAAREGIFGAAPAVGELRQTQRAMVPCHRSHRPQLESHADVAGVRNEDTNNLVYAPLNSVLYRMEDVQSGMKDEVDGLYLHLASADDSASTAKVVRGILKCQSSTTPATSTLSFPRKLLAQQKAHRATL